MVKKRKATKPSFKYKYRSSGACLPERNHTIKNQFATNKADFAADNSCFDSPYTPGWQNLINSAVGNKNKKGGINGFVKILY